jgi:arylsulfatase A-like enzyme
VDILPTLTGLAGLKTPESAQGKDHTPLLTGRRKEEAEPAALLNLPVSFSVIRREGFAEYRGIRTPRHTYARSIHGPWLLYDNQQDPFQMTNLVGKAEARALQSRMDRILERKLKAAGDEFLPGARYAERAQASHYREVNAPVGNAKSPWGDWQATWK